MKLAKNIMIFAGYSSKYKNDLGKNGYVYSEKYFNKKEILQNLKNEITEILKMKIL